MRTVSHLGLLIIVLQICSHGDTYRVTGNLCWSMPCLNGGSCFGTAYTYMCVCPINYSGALCEKRLGICQKNPCGNRGLCIEKSLTSFECRCYYDYIGPACEEHIKNAKRSIWSSLLPVHTQILFNMLQEAYHGKAKERVLPTPKHGQIDFLALLAAFTSAATTERMETVATTDRTETTEGNLVIPANGLQLEQLFPKRNITARKQSPHFENFTTEAVVENITIASTESSPFDYSDTTDNEELADTFSVESTTIVTDSSTSETISDTESTANTVTQMIDVTSSTDDNEINSTTSSPTIPNKHSQLIRKLCQKIFSRIFPNASSSINSSAILTQTANNTLNALLSWLNNHLNSTASVMTTTIPPTLVTDEIEYTSSSEPLQRVDMDDVLHQTDNYVDEENLHH